MRVVFDIRVARAGPESPSYRILIDYTPMDDEDKPSGPTQTILAVNETTATYLAEELLKAAKQLEEEKQNEVRRTQDRGDRGNRRGFFAKLFERWE